MQYVLERIKIWEEETSTREKFAIFGIFIFVLYLFYKFYYLPTKEKIEILKNDIYKLDLEIKKYKRCIIKAEGLNEKIKKRKEFLNTITALFPAKKEIAEVLQRIFDTAKKNNLEILLFEPQKEIPKDYYKIVPLKVEFTGNFKNIINFLNEINNLPCLIALNQIDFRSTGKQLNVIATFYTFQYTGKPLRNKKRK
jgi:type IV pilus assembly protein PilO